MPLNPDELELAENCYGYGRWDAPYWFVGLEEGQAPYENNDFTKRAKAFRHLNTDGLCDCREFHSEIEEYRWHNMNPKTEKVDLQSTWKYLMLLLMAYQGMPTDKERRGDLKRAYQCNQWGSGNPKRGETCVIELSGLPANNSQISRQRPDEILKELERIRPQRIERIQTMLRRGPRFVVMYGTTQKKNWRKIADLKSLQPCIPQVIGSTVFLMTQHPTSHYEKGQKKDQYWIDLGLKLRVETDLIFAV